MMALRRELVLALLIHENEVDKVIRQAKQLEDYINGNDKKAVLLEKSNVTKSLLDGAQIDLPFGGEVQ